MVMHTLFNPPFDTNKVKNYETQRHIANFKLATETISSS